MSKQEMNGEEFARLIASSEKQRRMYEAIMSTTPDLVYIFDLQHRFTYANQALLKMWGRSWEEAIGKNCLELGYEPWHATKHDREIESVITTKSSVRGEVPFNGTNGRRIYDYILVPVLNQNGEVEAIAGTTRDVTECKQADGQRGKNEETLRFLVDLNTATQHLTDPNEIMTVTARMLGEHLNVDRCAYAQVEEESIFVITGDYPKNVPSIVGRWPVAAFGRECVRLMLANQSYVVTDTDSDPRISSEDLAAYRATTIRSVICVPLHKAGKFTAAMAVHKKNPWNWTLQEIELVGMVVGRCWESLERAGVQEAIKEYAKELEKINRRLEQSALILEQRVMERTQLLEDQAGRLRQLAVELTEVEQKERRRLAELLHDDLQQYLVAAKMRLDLIGRKGNLDVDQKDILEARSYIDMAVDSSRQLTRELRPPVLYEGGLIAGLRYLVQKMKEQHKLQVHLSFSGDPEPGSDLMKVMIYQCIQELLFNAVKYAGVAECFVSVNQLENKIIQVVVEDKGCGFDFVNLSNNDKGGFGLFSIRERVKALGGEFNMSSILGKGSVFTLSISDKVDVTVEKKTNTSEGKVFTRKRSKEEGIVVLVVDDHAIIRQSMASLLKSQSFIKEVIEAGDGREALRKAEATDPDIILMDINMPIMNGIEATQKLSQSNPRSKIIGLSVQPESEMAQTMKEAGAAAYFNKGEDTTVLIQAIKNFSSSDPILP